MNRSPGQPIVIQAGNVHYLGRVRYAGMSRVWIAWVYQFDDITVTSRDLAQALRSLETQVKIAHARNVAANPAAWTPESNFKYNPGPDE